MKGEWPTIATTVLRPRPTAETWTKTRKPPGRNGTKMAAATSSFTPRCEYQHFPRFTYPGFCQTSPTDDFLPREYQDRLHCSKVSSNTQWDVPQAGQRLQVENGHSSKDKYKTVLFENYPLPGNLHRTLHTQQLVHFTLKFSTPCIVRITFIVPTNAHLKKYVVPSTRSSRRVSAHMRHPHGITRQILKQNLETMASTAPALGSTSRAKR